MFTRKWAKKWIFLAPALFLALGVAQPAQADLNAVGAVDPVTGFPLWFEDANGVRVQLCDVFDPNGVLVEQAPCLPELVDPNAGFVDGNIGEALFYGVDGETTAPDGTFIRAQCVLEAAGPAAVGETNTVGNAALIRMRNLVTAGNYSVVTPCGVFNFNHPTDTVDGEFGDEIVVGGAPTDLPPFSGALGPAAPVQIFASNGTGDPGFLGNGGGPLAGDVGPLSSPLQVGSTVTTVTVTLDGAPFATITDFAVVGKLSGCTAANVAPIANNDVETTEAETAIDINVLANDSDTVIEVALVGGVIVETPVTITPPIGTVEVVANSISPAGNGTAVANPDGTITFTPAATSTGKTTFRYTVTDACGLISNEATVTVFDERLTIGQAEYRARTGKWALTGSSNVNFELSAATSATATTYFTGLSGAQQPTPLTSPASGDFSATFDTATPASFDYMLEVNQPAGLDITQAHIHVGDFGVNGPIILFLCTDLGNAPAGTTVPACTADAGGVITVTGTLTAAEFQPGGGLATFNDAVTAIQNGGTYVNVHSDINPPGEIRGQIGVNVISLRAGATGPALGATMVPAGTEWSLGPKSPASLGAAPFSIQAESALGTTATSDLQLR